MGVLSLQWGVSDGEETENNFKEELKQNEEGDKNREGDSERHKQTKTKTKGDASNNVNAILFFCLFFFNIKQRRT